MRDDKHGIGEQNQAYRKGLVLGLTMAEVGILIIFVLLLLLAFGELERERVTREFIGKAPISPTELQRLQESRSTLQQLATALGISAESPADDFRRLVRVVNEIQEKSASKTALSEASQALQEIQRAREMISEAAQRANSENMDSVARQVEAQAWAIANQKGQLAHLEKQIRAQGGEAGHPPCWAAPTGEIEYLYDVTLTSTGIRMREYEYAHRAEERAALPAPVVNPEEVLSPAVFLARTAALFQFSKKQDCRFFVVVYDATAPHEKNVYKQLLRTVEDHFYKRLDNGPSPF